MDRSLALFVTLVVGLVVAASGVIAYVAFAPGTRVVQVSIVDYAFQPSTLTIRAGTTVRWVNMDFVEHTVTFGSHDEPMGEGSPMMGHMGAYVHTFVEPGTYAYHCDPHPYMTGAVVVTA